MQMEKNRQQYFTMLNGKQQGTDAKMDNLSRYLSSNIVDEKGKFYSQNDKYAHLNQQKLLEREH